MTPLRCRLGFHVWPLFEESEEGDLLIYTRQCLRCPKTERQTERLYICRWPKPGPVAACNECGHAVNSILCCKNID